MYTLCASAHYETMELIITRMRRTEVSGSVSVCLLYVYSSMSITFMEQLINKAGLLFCIILVTCTFASLGEIIMKMYGLRRQERMINLWGWHLYLFLVNSHFCVLLTILIKSNLICSARDWVLYWSRTGRKYQQSHLHADFIFNLPGFSWNGSQSPGLQQLGATNNGLYS